MPSEVLTDVRREREWVEKNGGVDLGRTDLGATLSGSGGAVTVYSVQVANVRCRTNTASGYVAYLSQTGGPEDGIEVSFDLDQDPPRRVVSVTKNRDSTDLPFPFVVTSDDLRDLVISATTRKRECSWDVRIEFAPQGGKVQSRIIDNDGAHFATHGLELNVVDSYVYSKEAGGFIREQDIG